MKKANSKENYLRWSLFFYLVLISIGYVTSTDLSRSFIVPIRAASVLLVAVGVVCMVGAGMIRKSGISAVLIYLLLAFYGVFLSLLNDAFEISKETFVLNAVVTVVGIFLLSLRMTRIIPREVSGWYVVYVVIGLILTLVSGGLVLSLPPEFMFSAELFSSGGGEIFYSQGMSKFFGIGLIFVAYLSLGDRGLRRVIGFGLSLVFAGLSLLGGGRGDSFLAIAVVLGYYLLIFSRKNITSIVIFVLVLASLGFGALFIFNQDMLFMQRFLALGTGDYGLRDILALEVLRLLSEEPRCLVFGCGFGYFQKYYGYSFGMYPHNIILEFIIVFGAPIFLLIFVGSMRGLTAYWRRSESIDLFLLLFIYLFMIGLKSGNVFGDWFFTAALMIFFVIGMGESRRPIVVQRGGGESLGDPRGTL